MALSQKLISLNDKWYRERIAQYREAERLPESWRWAAERQGWTNSSQQAENHAVAHEILLQVAKNKFQATVLDVGCGFGDFSASNIPGVAYRGIDISETMINIARCNHPKGHFYQLDILDPKTELLVDPCDIVVCLGVLYWSGIPTGRGDEFAPYPPYYLESMINRLLSLTKKCLIISFPLPDGKYSKSPHIAKVEPLEIFKYIYNRGYKINLRTDYSDTHYMIAIFKDDKLSDKLSPGDKLAGEIFKLMRKFADKL